MSYTPKAKLDAEYVNVATDIMTGQLGIQYGSPLFYLSDTITDTAMFEYITNNEVGIYSTTRGWSGSKSLYLSGNPVYVPQDPTADLGVATKRYVDNKVMIGSVAAKNIQSFVYTGNTNSSGDITIPFPNPAVGSRSVQATLECSFNWGYYIKQTTIGLNSCVIRVFNPDGLAGINGGNVVFHMLVISQS